MFNILEFRYVLRILLAGVCGIVIGIERKNRSKEAGVRTHFIVGLHCLWLYLSMLFLI